MSRPGNGGAGYKVTTRTIDVQQLVREAEGSAWDNPYYIYEFGSGERKFVSYSPYDWVNFPDTQVQIFPPNPPVLVSAIVK